MGHVEQGLYHARRDIEHDDRNGAGDRRGDDDQQQNAAAVDGILGADTVVLAGGLRDVDQAPGHVAEPRRDGASLAKRVLGVGDLVELVAAQFEHVARARAGRDQGIDHFLQPARVARRQLAGQHPGDAATRGDESLPQRLDQTAVGHATGLVEKAGRQVDVGPHGEQRAHFLDTAIDEPRDGALAVPRGLLAADHHVENRVVDQRGQRHQQPPVRGPGAVGQAGRRYRARDPRQFVAARLEYVVAAPPEGQQVFDFAPRPRRFRCVGQGPEIAAQGGRTRHEPLNDRLDQIRVRNIGDLGEQPRRVIDLRLDLHEPLRVGHAAVDQAGDPPGGALRDPFAGHDRIEHGVVDQRLQGFENPPVRRGEAADGILAPRAQREPALDEAVEGREIGGHVRLQGL